MSSIVRESCTFHLADPLLVDDVEPRTHQHHHFLPDSLHLVLGLEKFLHVLLQLLVALVLLHHLGVQLLVLLALLGVESQQSDGVAAPNLYRVGQQV